MDPATMRKSLPCKVVVTPVPPVDEEIWGKDPVKIELTYPEPASLAHIKGVTFAIPDKVAPVNKNTS